MKKPAFAVARWRALQGSVPVHLLWKATEFEKATPERSSREHGGGDDDVDGFASLEKR